MITGYSRRAVSVLAVLAFALVAVYVSAFAARVSAASGGPTVVLTTTSASTTNATAIPVTATFSEGMTGFAMGDVTVTGGSVSNFASTSSSVYTFNVNPTADGAVTVAVAADVANASSSPGKGNQASNTLTLTSDMTAPVISGVGIATTTTSATISWSTSEAAAGNVAYGTTIAYGTSTTPEAVATTTHSTSITGLAPSTTYHFKISATDAAGNVGTTTDATFVTGAAAAAPVISALSVGSITTTGATITWSTNVAANSQVAYGSTTSHGSLSALATTTTTSHSVTLAGLSEATVYHFAAISANGVGTTTSADAVFATKSTASTTPLNVTSIDSVQGMAVADGSFADGFKWLIHFIVPDNETSLQMKFADFTSQSTPTTIPAASNIRIYSAQSSNASSTSSALVSTNNDYGTVMQLTGDAASTTPGRQVDMSVEVAVPLGTTPAVYSTTFGTKTTP